MQQSLELTGEGTPKPPPPPPPEDSQANKFIASFSGGHWLLGQCRVGHAAEGPPAPGPQQCLGMNEAGCK